MSKPDYNWKRFWVPRESQLVLAGGGYLQTAPLVAQAGAQVLVAGSAVYNNDTTVADAIARIRESVNQV